MGHLKTNRKKKKKKKKKDGLLKFTLKKLSAKKTHMEKPLKMVNKDCSGDSLVGHIPIEILSLMYDYLNESSN